MQRRITMTKEMPQEWSACIAFNTSEKRGVFFTFGLRKCYDMTHKGENCFLRFDECFVFLLFVNVFVLRKDRNKKYFNNDSQKNLGPQATLRSDTAWTFNKQV
jgi:hypothetical protein